MRKQPANSEFFCYYNANPRDLKRNDCVVRALSAALNKSWDEVFTELSDEALRRKLMPNEDLVFESILKKYGWRRHACPKKENHSRYSGKEFLQENPEIECVASIGAHHLTYMKDGVIFDIWDCSNNHVGKIWIRDEAVK